MELWLIALIALALIPTVRLFMAASCRKAPKPPGTEPLSVTVTSTGGIPPSPRGTAPGPPERPAVVEITDGTVEVHPPSGDPTPSAGVPRGGIHHPGTSFTPDDRWFRGTESPYHWTAHCTVSYECTEGPRGAPGSGTVSATHPWDWDANREITVNFLLRLEDITPGDTTGGGDPPLVRNFRWVLVHS
jgi:hypothetical protein